MAWRGAPSLGYGIARIYPGYKGCLRVCFPHCKTPLPREKYERSEYFSSGTRGVLIYLACFYFILVNSKFPDLLIFNPNLEGKVSP